MNTKPNKLGSGIAVLIAAGVMISTPIYAEANHRPSPDAICPAADLVPECDLRRIEPSTNTVDGSPTLPRAETTASGSGGGGGSLSPSRLTPSPR